MKRILCVASVALALSLPTAHAADFSRLGQDLTPLGAEKAGNAAGTIPAWTGGIAKAPANYKEEDGYLDPFAGEQPLFEINKSNMSKYADNLAPGQMELMKRYPTFKMRVFPSHRTAAYKPETYAAVKAEAAQIKLAEGGNGVLNINKSTTPFPIPNQGIEIIWNHLFRDLGGTVTRYSADFPVQPDGTFTLGKRIETIAFASAMKDAEPNRLLYFKNQILAPANSAGEVALVHEPINQVEETRKAWIYNPGQRRVIRAPELAYDSPGIGADGLRTNDDLNGFNGAPDRYDWKLIGKKEMYIPYNNYQLGLKSLKYNQIIQKNHINPDVLRYELHRVWVVEANLKPGKSHIYKKRVFYFDEDSWAIVHSDKYDGRGELWRVREIFGVQAYIAPTFGGAGEVLYDLNARRYLVNGLSNEEPPIEFGQPMSKSDFTTAALRRMGR